MPATTTTCSEHLVDQTTKGAEPTMMTANMVEPTTGKDVVNVATTEVTEQEASGQVAPEQSLAGTLSERHLSAEQGHVPENSQDVPEQDATTPSSTQSGLSDTAARGKVAVRP
jgi:hypothetical protein